MIAERYRYIPSRRLTPCSNHVLGVLEKAGLVNAVRKGRERFSHLDATPIQAIHERWIGPHAAHAAAGLSRLKKAVEGAGKKIDA